MGLGFRAEGSRLVTVDVQESASPTVCDRVSIVACLLHQVFMSIMY